MLLLMLCTLTTTSGGERLYNYRLLKDADKPYNLVPPAEEPGLFVINEGSTVYYDRVGSVARSWFCRMMGYKTSAGSQTSNVAWHQYYPIRYTDVRCTGNVLPQCRYSESYASYIPSLALQIRCTARTQLGDSDQFYLVDHEGRYTETGYGLLMYNGGTISGNQFDDVTAEVVCRIMGYDRVRRWSMGKRYEFQEAQPIRYNNVNCLGTEDVFPVCVYGSDTSQESHDNDVWLWCGLPKYANYNKLVCPPGNMLVDEETCQECPPSTYSLHPSQRDSCSPCPDNSTSRAGAIHCSCAENLYLSPDNTRCLKCPGTSSSQPGSLYCSCPGGSYLAANLTVCETCPDSTISTPGSRDPAACTMCPEGAAPSQDRTMCLRLESNNHDLSLVGLILSILLPCCVVGLMLYLDGKRRKENEARQREVVHARNPPRDCLCPECPCSARIAME